MVYSCYGMHCPWEDFRGECTWKRGLPYPCNEEFDEDMVDEEDILDDDEE